MALTVVALCVINIIFYKHAHSGCRTWVCTYEKHKYQPIDGCTDYHIKAGNETADCYACLSYTPVNGSTCYDNGLSRAHGGYCPAYLTCENEGVYAEFLAMDLGGGCILLLTLVAIIIQCATPQKEYIIRE